MPDYENLICHSRIIWTSTINFHTGTLDLFGRIVFGVLTALRL
jgi:hypothetical protein